VTHIDNNTTAGRDQLVKTLEHPQALGSFRSWISLLTGVGDIDPKFIPRILVVSFFSLVTSPLRAYEWIRYNRLIKKSEIHPSPVIILGHWRTGTTHLQNLLCQDKKVGYVTTFQAMAPGFFLVGEKTIKPILEWIVNHLYPTRMIDNIPLSMDMPQEEEYAVANLCPYSFLHMFSFPRQAEWFFKRYVLFENLSESEAGELIDFYLEVLRKASFRTNGAPLVLKNPAHSGRLPSILKMFPHAKFIHIIRNPYDVYLSMAQLYKVVLPRSQLHDINWEKVEENFINFYIILMRKFLADKEFIPAGNLVEIKFENLETSPVDTIKEVYERLNLPGFEEAKPNIQAYVDSVVDYHKNQYTLTPEIIERVNQHWGFAFKLWGYEQLE